MNDKTKAYALKCNRLYGFFPMSCDCCCHYDYCFQWDFMFQESEDLKSNWNWVTAYLINWRKQVDFKQLSRKYRDKI